MKLSIIIPAYNAENYIVECLESIQRKVNNNLEILIINDGSTDNTLKKIKDYKELNNQINIRIYDNSNNGVSISRNIGITEAKGNYIMFLDSDDCLKNGWENIINYISGEDIIYINSKLDMHTKSHELIDHIIGIKEPHIMTPVSKLYKTDFLRKNNISFKNDLINGEDLIFNIECLKNMKTFSIINQAIYMYRQNPKSATKSFNEGIIRSDMNFHSYLNHILDDIDISTQKKEEIKDYCKQNAIVTIFDRLAYVSSLKNIQNHLKFLEDDIYRGGITKISKYLTPKSRIFLVLIKFRLYKISILLLKIKHGKVKFNKKNYFIEI